MKLKPIILAAGTIPDSIEEWSESLTPPGCYWYVYPDTTELLLDSAHAFSGVYCVGGRYYKRDPWMLDAVDLTLFFSPPLDIRGYNRLFFLHLLDISVPGFYGDSRCIVSCEWYDYGESKWKGGVFEKDFVTTPGVGKAAYQAKEWDLLKDFVYTPADRPAEEALANLYSFRVIGFINPDIAKEYLGQRMFLDRIYFSQEHSFLQVRSEPPGKSFAFDGITFVAPRMFEGLPGDTHEIVMSNAEFSEWEDHSTDRARVVTMPAAGKTSVITAYYVGAPPPNEDKEGVLPNLMEVALPAALATTALIGSVVTVRRLRR